MRSSSKMNTATPTWGSSSRSFRFGASAAGAQGGTSLSPATVEASVGVVLLVMAAETCRSSLVAVIVCWWSAV